MQGYRALLSSPWYLNLGVFDGSDWLTYYNVEPLAWKVGLNCHSVSGCPEVLSYDGAGSYLIVPKGSCCNPGSSRRALHLLRAAAGRGAKGCPAAPAIEILCVPNALGDGGEHRIEVHL